MAIDYEVLAKASPQPFSDEFETVGCRMSDSFNLRDGLVFGELRPVDGGTSIVLDKPSITFGQDRTCDVVIEHPSVAANHCHMEIRDGHWFIEDLGSRDGICVNGEKVMSAWVPAQSVINIGGLEFDLEYSSAELAEVGQGPVSPLMLSKLERALESIPTQRRQRVQVRVGEPMPSDVPTEMFGVLRSSEGGFPIPLLYDELYLGRDPDCDVILPSVEVARTHCVLRFQEGFWRVRDLNNNGVSIDGQGVQEGWLRPGALLGVATHRFEIEYSTSSISPPETVVAINEFDLPNDDNTLIDSDDALDVECATPIEIAVEPPIVEKLSRVPIATPAIDEPHVALDDMLTSLEEMLPQLDDQLPALSESQEASCSPSPCGSEESTNVANHPGHKGQGDSNSEMLLGESQVSESQVSESQVSESQVSESPITDPQVFLPRTIQTSPPTNWARSKGKRRRVNGFGITNPPSPASEHREAQTIARPMMNEELGSYVQQKQERILQFLKDREFGGLLLTRPSNIAWCIGGADVPSSFSGQVATALLITPESSTVLGHKSDRELLLNSATPGIGLKHRECDWTDRSRELLKGGLGLKKLACDQPFEPCVDASADVATMRRALSWQELEILRILGVRVARTVEKVAREFCRGDTEAQIAGDIASRLVRHGVVPKRIQVWGDGRGQHCPNWRFGRDPVERYCTISVVAQRQGLHVAVSRTVSFGFPSKELRWTFADMFLAHATGLLALRDQAELATVWTRVESACEKLGCAAEFRETGPGCITGYEQCETLISANSSERLRTDMPVIWQSSVGPARAVDTILVREADCKLITQTDEWPQTRLVIKKARVFGAAVLERSM